MITLISFLVAIQPVPPTGNSPSVVIPLAELFRLSDEYRQCLILDKSRASEPIDTYSAEFGSSAENLDLLLSDRQDSILKQLIEQRRGGEIIDAIRLVRYTQVKDDYCRYFDPYFGPALDKLEELEAAVGLTAEGGQKRRRPQRPRSR